MNLNANRWKKLFLFCLGLSAGTAFCMKWIEDEFWANGEKFTMMGLELFYSKEKVMTILSGLDAHTRAVLSYHLYFDFAFMTGIFPGIAAMCMMAREKIAAPALRKLLFALAWLQIIAWGGDIAEDLYLLKWLKHPVIGDDFALYHFIVASKWIIALSGALVSAPLLLVKIKK